MALNDIKFSMLEKHCTKENIRFGYTRWEEFYGLTIIADNGNPDRDKVTMLAEKYGFEVIHEAAVDEDDRFPVTYYYLESKSIN